MINVTYLWLNVLLKSVKTLAVEYNIYYSLKYGHISFLAQGVTGTVHVEASRCLDITLPGFQNVESTGCVDVSRAFDKDEWGSYVGSTFTELTGVACTCEEPGCNHPEGLSQFI